MTEVVLPTPGRSAAPTVAYGVGAVQRIPTIVEHLGARRILLVCGNRSFEASGAATMVPRLERVATIQRWSDFRPNTDSADLVVGLDILQEHAPDLVLGIGGGSALDMAKLLVSYGDVPPDQVVESIETGRTAERRSSKLVLAPTTSGSGAEATHFSVVYVGHTKYSIAGPAMRADAVVLDPGLTLSGSRYQRATSGIDAVAQAIESLWATGATRLSRRFARHALRLLMPAIGPFVNDADLQAARAMTIGSHLAGRAIDISKTTAAHALSYAITKRHGVSHGHAVALTLGAFIELHAQAEPAQLQESIDPDEHRQAMGTVLSRLDATSPAQARSGFVALVERLGLTSSLSEVCGGGRDEVRRIALSANAERLGNNPVRLDSESLTRLLGAQT